MNTDDEIEVLLSAYLDDELTSIERSQVENALIAEPGLVLSYERLKQSRDLIATLPRPAAPAGFAGRVVQVAVKQRRARQHLRRIAWIGSSIAASLVVGLWSMNFPNPTKNTTVAIKPTIQPRPITVGPDVSPEPLPIEPIVAYPSHSLLVDVEADPRDWKQQLERQHIRSLLERNDVKRILVVTDVFGDRESGKIDRLVANTPRSYSHFGRTTVSQGLVIDPDHPGEAIVFTVIMTDAELKFFREQLMKVATIADDSPAPEVMTQLAEVGEVLILPGTQPARLQPILESTQSAIALREEGDEEPTQAQLYSGPHPSNRDPLPHANEDRPAPAPRDTPTQRLPGRTVLVWVTATPKRGNL